MTTTTDSFTPNPITSFFSHRRRDVIHPTPSTPQLAAFQRQVALLLSDLSSNPTPILSLKWFQSLLETFIIIQEEFRIYIHDTQLQIHLPPLMADYFDRAVKALDILNAVRDSVDKIRGLMKHVEIVVEVLGRGGKVGDGHLRRAAKALGEVAILMGDGKSTTSNSNSPCARNRSFNRIGNSARDLHFRSMSWSIQRTWSAAKQIQSIGANLAAPKAQEVSATGGVANAMYTMSSVLLFVTWSLAAAFPCLDGGLQGSFGVPRSFPWGEAMMGMHERVVEEGKKKDRKRGSGMLKEMMDVERCVRRLSEMIVEGEVVMDGEVMKEVEELKRLRGVMGMDLEPLERQVREVFRRIVRSRTEVLDSNQNAI